MTNTEESWQDGISRVLGELLDRLRNLEGEVELRSTVNDARLKALETRFIDMGKKITDEANQLNKLREMHHDLLRGPRVLERITALENGSRLVGTGQLISEIMSRLDALEGRLRVEKVEEFSPPIGGVDRLQEIPLDKVRRAERSFISDLAGPDILTMTNTEGKPVQGRVYFQRGYSAGFRAGFRAGIDEAASRVQEVFDRFPGAGEALQNSILEALASVISSKLGTDESSPE